MKTDIIVYRIEGPPEVREIDLPDPTEARFHDRLYEVIRGYVGTPPEHVNVFYDFNGNGDHRYRDMFVNENGHILGMPRNPWATTIYRNNVLAHTLPGSYQAEDLPWIAGTAVLFRDRVWR
jgi:hypothetical protein